MESSTLPPLIKAIATREKASQLTSLAFTFIDERLVPYDADGSNYGSMRGALEEAGLKSLALPCDDSTEAASVYQQKIAGDALPSLDMLLLGYGDDGHIASLFPGSDELDKACSTEKWLFRATASYEPKERWSWGMEALTNSANTICLFKGPAEGSKADRLNEALNDENCDTPLARFLRSAEGPCHFFHCN